MDEMAARVANPPYPFQQWFSGTLRTAAISQERTDFIALEAGQAAPLLRHRNAAALMADLVRETPRLLARLSR
jgi:nitronate monooxygenase